MISRHLLAVVAAVTLALPAAAEQVAVNGGARYVQAVAVAGDYDSLVGKPVQTADGVTIGHVSGVIRASRSTAVRQLVMSSDSPFGLLAEPLSVPVEQIGYDPSADVVVLAMTEAEIRAFH